LLAHGRCFSLGTPASSTTKTGRHDIAEILLKVALNTKNQNQSTGTPVSNSSTNKTDSHDITEILLKVALNTINQFFIVEYFSCPFMGQKSFCTKIFPYILILIFGV
jgi:hypothetical protein